MFTNNFDNENKLLINPVQETPPRSQLYALNKCEDQVIGFEFISREYESNPNCFNGISIHLCVPVEVVKPISVDSVEFTATNDPCYKDLIVQKTELPEIEILRDIDSNCTGILVRFSQYESCCYPNQMAFKLYLKDDTGCKYTISSGLLFFRP